MTTDDLVVELAERLVTQLIREGAIASSSIEDAFRRVRRHLFLPDAPLEEVYRDMAVVTHRGSDGVPVNSSSQPAIMARMLRQLEVQPGHRVLEIGAGTGRSRTWAKGWSASASSRVGS